MAVTQGTSGLFPHGFEVRVHILLIEGLGLEPLVCGGSGLEAADYNHPLQCWEIQTHVYVCIATGKYMQQWAHEVIPATHASYMSRVTQVRYIHGDGGQSSRPRRSRHASVPTG